MEEVECLLTLMGYKNVLPRPEKFNGITLIKSVKEYWYTSYNKTYTVDDWDTGYCSRYDNKSLWIHGIKKFILED